MVSEPDLYQPGAPGRRVPSAPPYLVERRRLDHVHSAAEGRLVRVVAPAGYGKTTLVARWASADQRCIRWVDLDRGDDDPVALLATLTKALAGLYEISSASVEHSAAADRYVRSLQEYLSGTRATVPFLFVLDDVHRIRSVAANRLLAALFAHVPPDSTVVLLGHGHHDHGSIARLRLRPGVVDVTARDLAFDESESHRLVEQMGVDPSRPGVAEVLRELEGWPAGIRLAGDVVRSGGSPQYATEHANIVHYLREEWIGQLDESDRTFLTEAACLEALSGDECDRVLGRHGSGRVLRRLHRDQVVVFALDERDGWYRMHGLLRRWLSADLEEADAERWTQIHLNAAAYWEALGDIDRAIAHVIAVGDLEVLERMVTVHGGRYFTRGLDASVERWLGAFPPEHVRRSPALSGLQCVKALHRGDDIQAVQWLRLLDRAVDDRRAARDHPADWWGSVLHAALDERPSAELTPTVAKAEVNLAGGPWAAFACWVHGALAFLDGDVAAARDALRAGAFEAQLADTQLIVGHCLGTLSIIDDWDGELASAARHATLAEDAVRSCGGELRPPAAVAMAAIALQQARRDDRDAAVRSIAVSRASLLGFRSIGPWFNIIARVALVRAALLLDDRPLARVLIHELEHHARLEPPLTDPGGHGANAIAGELRGQVEAMHVPATGSSALTDAELRVLHLLSTNLSLAEIATRLYLSRNTVKSHAASIYRKLDATRRTDAVERARAAGLLPAP